MRHTIVSSQCFGLGCLRTKLKIEALDRRKSATPCTACDTLSTWWINDEPYCGAHAKRIVFAIVTRGIER